MCDPVVGVYSSISPLGMAWARGPVPLPLVWSCLCSAKSNEKLFCETEDDPWRFLDQFWGGLISLSLFSTDLKDFVRILDAIGPSVPVVPR